MMSDLRAYEVSIEHVYCTLENLGEIGKIRGYEDLWGIYYATTPSKAKHQFIKYYNELYDTDLEYTSPIKVRLIAKNVIQTNSYTNDFESDWRKSDLTVRGQELDANWKQAEAYLAEVEA